MNKILIVEDELVAAEYLKQILEQNDFIVLDIVDNGKEAIKKAKELKPDIILMDIMLQDNISGCEAAVEISQNIKTSIIFLTAHIDDEMARYAIEAKAAGYLTKPYNETQIITTLKLLDTKKDILKPLHVKSNIHELELKDGFIFKNGRVFKNNNQIALGPKALKLLKLLCEQPNISISNEQICMSLWGELVDDRTLRSLIFRMRTLLGENVVKNISGSGYMVCTK